MDPILNESEQLAFVKKNGFRLEFCKDPSEAVQLAAVQQNGRAIGFCKAPSESVQLAAVQQNPFSIIYFSNPYNSVIEYLSIVKWLYLFYFVRYDKDKYYKIISLLTEKYNHLDIIPIIY